MEKNNLDKLRKHKPTIIGLAESKKAAVCIPLIETETGYDLLFEVRAADIDSQPGDICFPGGRLEEGETPEEAALREIGEELFVERDQVELLGLMDLFGGGSGMLYVYPYAVLLRDYEGTYSPNEVERVFTVPLAYLLEQSPEIYQNRMKVMPDENFPYDRIHGGKEYGWRQRREDVLFYQYGDETIWGMTARILRSFLEIYSET